jgi:hypothetical protein
MIRPTSTIATVMNLQRIGDEFYIWDFASPGGTGNGIITWLLDRDTYIKFWGFVFDGRALAAGNVRQVSFQSRERVNATYALQLQKSVYFADQNYAAHDGREHIDLTFMQGALIQQQHYAVDSACYTYIIFRETEVKGAPLSDLPVIQLEKRSCGLWELITGRCYS